MGENATVITPSSLPVGVLSCCPEEISQSVRPQTALAVASRRPSGEKATPTSGRLLSLSPFSVE